MKSSPLSKLYIHADAEQERDTVNTYKVVDRGFRSTPLLNSPDILSLGCSQTWGVGVPDNAVWNAVLSKNLSMSYFNMGIPGASIMSLVGFAIDYIEKYGAPKYVVALWPDIRRMRIPMEDRVNSTAADKWAKDVGVNNSIDVEDVHFPYERFGSGSKSLTANFSKRPHVLHEVNSYSMPFFYNIEYLRFFMHYCKLKNIKMVFSSWDDDTTILLKELELENFYFLDWLHYDRAPNHEIYVSDCHPDMQDVYGMNWCRGADHRENNMGHIGIHEHLDYAEMFERVIRDGQ